MHVHRPAVPVIFEPPDLVEELIPEAHLGEHSHSGTLGVMAGFLVMMILDVALG